jgi:2,3-dihydroxybiphenyl 1,2-dioxygenase
MTGVSQLGYLGIGVRDLGEWTNYATGVLGLQVAGSSSRGALLRMDGHHHRFVLTEDESDDIAFVGWQVDDAQQLTTIAERLQRAGVALRRGTREEAERRHVRELITFADPDGYSVELFVGPELASSSFRSTKSDTSFVAENQGLGHLVLASSNLERSMRFYTDMLGMKVSDYVKLGKTRLGFLHCNARHHSIAFIELPMASKRINHFMLQLDSIDSVGRTYDAIQEGAAPLLVTMGRHSNDEMVSFYMANPSRFGVEYGWGGREIDDCTWQVQQYESGDLWGHRPVRRSERAAASA